MLSRRDLLKASGGVCLAPLASALTLSGTKDAMRCLNVVNFIRGVEPRGPMDLMLPVRKQMEIALQYRLPTTWLLQYDALVSGPFVEYLKANMAKDHEVGVWFEMNEMHCRAAGVAWRGRPGYEWDHYPDVAFTIGYTAEERLKLADAFVAKFREVWGRTPKSVASWNLDSITVEYLARKYGVDAFAVCRDQIATDGFTIWGAPIAGYYPSKRNLWSPAVAREEQIDAPVFRMLGQDPVYYYEGSHPTPNGRRGGPDTMEPVWPSGRSEVFIERFLEMIERTPTLDFAYAQLGQENNFGWPEMAEAYPKQMKALADLRAKGRVHVETMGESGRRFKKAFRTTPPQAQIMLDDPFGNLEKPEGTVWYGSRFYRANLHLKDGLPYLRDLTVYRDQFAQPFLTEATRLHDVEQRMLAVLDGYHWSPRPGSSEPGAGGYFTTEEGRLRLTGRPKIVEKGSTLKVEMLVTGGRTLHVEFGERTLSTWLTPSSKEPFAISFEWDPRRAALVSVEEGKATYRWQGFDYSVGANGLAQRTTQGWTVKGTGKTIELRLEE